MYLQTNEGAFTNRLPFVNIPAFICVFLTLALDTALFTFSAAYQISLTISADHMNVNSMV